MRLLLVLLPLLMAPAALAADKVTMYGASWCGPCRTVRAYLSQSGVPFTYRDIDEDAARKAYVAVRGNARGIPLTVIGRTKIVGANLERLAAALRTPSRGPKASGAYGGHSAAWWQQQFQGLRRQLGLQDARIKKFEKVAVDHVETAMLARMKENRKILQASLDQMENDASRVSLPRKFRR